MRVPEATCAGNATGGSIWFIEIDQPQSLGDFDHGSQPATAGRNQVNLLLLLLQEQGDLLASTQTGDEEPYDM